jgi:hypothetical protein
MTVVKAAAVQRGRKIPPTYHERMVWGQRDGSGLRAVDSRVQDPTRHTSP